MILFVGLVIFRRAERRNLIAIVDKLFRQRRYNDSVASVWPGLELRAG